MTATKVKHQIPGMTDKVTTSDGSSSSRTMTAPSARDLYVFRAEVCSRAARFDDMAVIMKEMCSLYDDLTIDERNLLSCAYKNVIGSRRTSRRILHETFETQMETNTTTNKMSTANQITASHSNQQANTTYSTGLTENQLFEPRYDKLAIISDNQKQQQQLIPRAIKSLLSIIDNELKTHCQDIIAILTDRLIPSVSANGESGVFYYKMKGDYSRYLCETCSGSERKEMANESLMAYKTASDRAMIELPPTHPVRLGLMLNFSVFYYEIMKSPERSCRLAKQAFDDAIAELDTLSEESYRDSTIIMQLLRDNLNLWQSESSQTRQSTNEIQQQQKQFN